MQSATGGSRDKLPVVSFHWHPDIDVLLAWVSNYSRHDRSDKRIDDVIRRIDDVQTSGHKDALEILRSMTALHERVAVVETKQAQ